MIRLIALLASLFFAPAWAACPPLLDHRFTSLQGEQINLCDYADKPILVVNTASKCGYTPQFEKLENLYRDNKAKGLRVVGFPSNDFNQELATDKAIAKFCTLTYAVEFPMVSKGSVKGSAANPFYKALAKATGEEPRWNFHKYLILPGARQVFSFATQTEPDAPEIFGKIKPYLK